MIPQQPAKQISTEPTEQQRRKPLARIPWDAVKTRDEIAAYRKHGIRHFTTFAVYVDDDYVNAFGPAALDCVREYGQLLRFLETSSISTPSSH